MDPDSQKHCLFSALRLSCANDWLSRCQRTGPQLTYTGHGGQHSRVGRPAPSPWALRAQPVLTAAGQRLPTWSSWGSRLVAGSGTAGFCGD